ncbi:rRNA maturation RNase YbeY [Candidatus Falkowbacteria bacterium]|nr:rRNA maturation RNase YbeY [Candidatus Falkowbacteria bacterium]
MIIEINNQTDYSIPKEKIDALLRLAGRVLKIRKKQRISVAFVPSARIREMNRIYRKKNKITDVLSFALSPSESEIIICPSAAKAQAKKQPGGFQQEILALVLHGFLHINGFEHEKSKIAARKMEKIEEDIITKSEILNPK